MTALLVLFANLLMAREPIYGVGEWAALFPPDLFGLRQQDLTRLHDDGFSPLSLIACSRGSGSTLIMAANVRHVILVTAISLDDAAQRFDRIPSRSTGLRRGRPGKRTTWGRTDSATTRDIAKHGGLISC